MNEKEIIQYYIQRLYDKNLTTMSGGNLSIKGSDSTYVTPSEVDKGRLTSEDIMEVKKDGTTIGKHRVTSEFYVHEAVYETNPSMNAVLHSHTSSILGFSTARILPKSNMLAEVGKYLDKKIDIAKYADPGTKDLANETSRILDGNRKVAILENHGLFIVDKTMEKCYDVLEDLDLVCKIEENIAKINGEVKTLSSNQLNEFEKFRHQYQKSEIECSCNYIDEKKLIIELLQRLYKRGISTCKNACFSYRLENGDIIVNPQDVDVCELTVDDMIVVKDGKYIGVKSPHSDFYLHMTVYNNDSRNNGVITCKPPYAMAYACSNKEYITKVVPECYGYLRNINKYDFVYGDKACEIIKGVFGDYNNTILISNYLALVAAEYPLKAYDRCEVLESTANAIIDTMVLKEPVYMDQRAVEVIQKNCGIYPENK